MLANIITGTLDGINSKGVIVETDITNGLPALNMVGLASTSIKESSERIRSAIINSDYSYPRNRITVNLSPADMRKDGTHFDLPIALGLLISSGEIKLSVDEFDLLAHTAFFGELSLNGNLMPIKGALPMLLGMKKNGVKRIIIPLKNFSECKVLSDIEIIGVSSLKWAAYAVSHDSCALEKINDRNLEYQLKETSNYEMGIDIEYLKSNMMSRTDKEDFADIKGQEAAKRAILVAAAGFHNIFMIGSPGGGKTMLASRLPGILPDMSFDEILETTSIYSISGELSQENHIIFNRPFRSPHHSATLPSLIGGGNNPMPGEISLAHNGVLFLDEILEFPRSVLESLRQPIETRKSIITRNNKCAEFPSNVLLVGAANPCKCGYYGDPNHECRCSMNQILNYRNKLSGPLLDRIDIQIEIPSLNSSSFFNDTHIGMSTEEMKEAVQIAVEIQKNRFKKYDIKKFNAHMNSNEIREFCSLGSETEIFVKKIFDSLNLSGRSYQKLLKVSRTIADLEKSTDIKTEHLAEAIRYRLNLGKI